MCSQRAGTIVLSFLILSLGLAFARQATAQAWLPPKGEGSVTISYENFYSRDHLTYTGEPVYVGDVQSHVLLLDVDFGLTDQIAFSMTVPYIAARYQGPAPHAGSLVDDGQYHHTLQDVRFGFRYNLRPRPAALTITPFVEGFLPSSHYETLGHAGLGLDLRGVEAGVAIGRQLDPLLRRAYFQTRLSYAMVQEVLGIRPNRTILDTEFGYFVTRRLILRAFENFQITHAGIDYPVVTWAHEAAEQGLNYPGAPAELRANHDRLWRVNFLSLGGGAAFAINDAWALFGSYSTLVWGENGHANRAFAFGASWSFSTGLSAERGSEQASAGRD